MAIRDSEEEEADFEASILDFKGKLHLLLKRKLVSLMNALIDDFQKLTSDNDHFFNAHSSIRFSYIDLKTYKTGIDKENSTIKD